MLFNFPPEIQDLIFEWTVSIRPHHPSDAWLATVSKRVQSRVEPILYETVILHRPGPYNWLSNVSDGQLFNVAVSHRPSAFFAAHIRNLMLFTSVPSTACLCFLSVCTNLQSLAMWAPDSDSLAAIVQLPLRSLDTDRNTVLRLAAGKWVLPDLKSLCIGEWPDCDTMPGNMEWAPGLMHVRVLAMSE